MEKGMSGFPWRSVIRGLTAVMAVGLFCLFYYWLLAFGAERTQEGNFALAVFVPLLSVATYSVLRGVGVPGPLFWYRNGLYVVWAVVITTLIHVVGFMMPTEEMQAMFLFAPVIMAGVGVLLRLAYLLDRGAEKKYENRP